MIQAKEPRTGATAVMNALDLHDQHTIDLGTRLIEAAMDDASVLEGIPRGATLVLLPDDDSAYIEEAIEVGLTAIRQGWDVFFRHLRMSCDPTSPDGDQSRS